MQKPGPTADGNPNFIVTVFLWPRRLEAVSEPRAVATGSGSLSNQKRNLAEKDYSKKVRNGFSRLFLIRSLPLAVLTHPLYAWAREDFYGH